ncbi:hypothetical protein GCM10009547_30440 [Sporichthya brevicatena]|uniref:DUF4870 domain-containing protein n=1 Tax=Sporichthya brevicatena TaxID=171442 RepID=A0ABN1H057_9ACTN
MPTQSERRRAAIVHVASIPGMAIGLGFVGPLIALRVLTRGSTFVRAHAVAAVNFNVTVGLVGLAGLIGTASLSRVGDDGGPDWAAGATVVLIVLLTVGWFLLTVRAAMAARYGEAYRYPVAAPFLRV